MSNRLLFEFPMAHAQVRSAGERLMPVPNKTLCARAVIYASIFSAEPFCCGWSMIGSLSLVIDSSGKASVRRRHARRLQKKGYADCST